MYTTSSISASTEPQNPSPRILPRRQLVVSFSGKRLVRSTFCTCCFAIVSEVNPVEVLVCIRSSSLALKRKSTSLFDLDLSSLRTQKIFTVSFRMIVSREVVSLLLLRDFKFSTNLSDPALARSLRWMRNIH